jgi:hypothetical protein
MRNLKRGKSLGIFLKKNWVGGNLFDMINKKKKRNEPALGMVEGAE